MKATNITTRDENDTVDDGLEADLWLTTGLIPGFALGPNANLGGIAGAISEPPAGGGAATSAAVVLEAETEIKDRNLQELVNN